MSDTVKLTLENNQQSYRPGETVRGKISWNLAEAPSEMSARIFWYTEGKGDRDLEIAAEQSFPNPGARGERDFELQLPPAPYSFSGRLISLNWAVEAIDLDSEECSRQNIIVSPNGQEINLNRFGSDA